MKTELYGLPQHLLDELAQAVGQILGLQFEKRDSLHRGIYFLAQKGDTTVRLQRNLHPEEGVPVVPGVPVPSLLWLSAGRELDELRSKLLASDADAVLIDPDSSL